MLTYEKYSQHKEALGLTDYKISVLTGIPKSTFSEWKAGRYTPKIEKIIKICKVLSIPLDEVFTDGETSN